MNSDTNGGHCVESWEREREREGGGGWGGGGGGLLYATTAFPQRSQ